MSETKELGEDIHFRLGLSGDTTEKKKTRHRRDEKISKRSHVEDHPCLRRGLLSLKGQHMETSLLARDPS